ncbi:MAG: T9SS type A sorting domain-containing protein [Bacteroidales bacterium]|nr:T9SS type A sorting domain-containing protein [Bacteroidales bacterium]
MKKQIFLFAILVLPLLSQAQIGLFNKDVDQQWNETLYVVGIGEIECIEERVITKGDAIIRDESTVVPIIQNRNDTIGFFRQDGEKYYYTSKTFGKEFLLYDFGVQTGDVVSICYDLLWGMYDDLPQEIEEVTKFTVTKVDLITDKNGTERKRISLDCGDVWIEGIGSLNGLIHSCRMGDGAYTKLLSYKENGAVIMEYEPDCLCEKTAINTILSQIKISPNPVHDELHLTLPNAENEIKIYDLQGKLLLQQNVGFSAEINVSMLTAGTYVLVINGESYKFVKE